jgi:hypothetical protein
MALNITQTFAKIGIETTPSSLELRTQRAQLEIRQKHAKVIIETEPPRLEIDQYEAFASAGFKNNSDLLTSEIERVKQEHLETIGKIVDDGNTLAAIENGGNPIAEIAVRDSYTTHEFNIDFIPKAMPKFNLIEGEVNIEVENGDNEGINNGVEVNYIPAQMSINYTPAQVKIFLSQYASIKFEYIEENKIDTYI